MKKRLLVGSMCTVLLTLLLAGVRGQTAEAADIPIYHDIPAYQYKDVYSQEIVTVSGVTVDEVVNATVSPVATTPIMEPVTFRIYNTTAQRTEAVVTSEKGELPDLHLINNHNYTIFAEDPTYRMGNVYLWIRNGIPVEIKNAVSGYDYPRFECLELYRRDPSDTDIESGRRAQINLPVLYGEGKRYNVKFKLISEEETIETNSGNNGMLRARLLEDVTYMVTVDDAEFDMEPLPLAVKDKSEYGLGRYTYNHSNCKQITEIRLIKKEDLYNNDTTLVSMSGNTMISGMNFNDYLLLDKEDQLVGIDPLPSNTVRHLLLVNPHRWEISKIAVGQFDVTMRVESGKLVDSVYLNGSQKEELEFTQSGNLIRFTMNNMSIYPVVVEYNETEPGPEALPFTDVNFTEWYYDAVNYVYMNGLMTGKDSTTFAPLEPLARAQFATVLHRMNGAQAMEYTDVFADVGEGAWYEDAVLWAAKAGVVTGYSNGCFGPSDDINREQMAVMMYRYAGYKGYNLSVKADFSHYQDAGNVSEFAEEAMQWAVGEGIITGKYNETMLEPQGNASRAECSMIMMRFVEKFGM